MPARAAQLAFVRHNHRDLYFGEIQSHLTSVCRTIERTLTVLYLILQFEFRHQKNKRE